MAHRIASGPRGPRERGAALLTALVAVAVLTAFAVDLAYSSRVSLQIAGNARDELRALYLARSGVAMSRLLLSFQQKLDGVTQANAAIPRIQLWTLVPVDRAFADALFSGAPAGPAPIFDTPETKPEATGPTFDADIDDEARKVSAQFFGFIGVADLTVGQRVQALYQLMCPARFDPLFEREDANGVRTSREDLLVRLRDWVDEDAATSNLAQGAGSTSAQCGLVVGQPSFVDAFGDENQLYDRGDDRYKTKNAQMDSLDELYLVYGIGDAFMGAFGDALTVYLKDRDKQNVNTLDARQLVANAFRIANPKNQPTLFDPELGNKLVKIMREVTFNGLTTISPQMFGQLVAALGITIDARLLEPNGPFSDRSKVFRVRATGKAGAVKSTIDAVVRMEDTKLPGEQLAQPGRIVHWRED